ncbi:hypothetical protein B0O80DRAFT_307395 [Mortierella sp. GBAus27b]|nr:hypothetical protein B0O80DRAFT_307395 [Mortierella sp. GBAus27b]
MFNRSTGRIPSLGLMALATLSYISSVSANIKFDPVPLGPIAPSTKMVITWTELPPNGTATSSDPFEFVLRAESGQRYSLQKDVPQSLKTITVTLPKTTGGRVITTQQPLGLFLCPTLLGFANTAFFD